MYKKKTIVIKIGTQVICSPNGLIDDSQIESIARQISKLESMSYKVILISSGAVGAGKSYYIGNSHKQCPTNIQSLASIGQPILINKYKEYFEKYDLIGGQMLLTKEAFRDRDRYLGIRRCLDELMQNDVIPIVNENDVINKNRLTFSDNDELAGLISAMINVDKLIILSSVDGVFDGDPKNQSSKAIKKIKPNNEKFKKYLKRDKSNLGRGGMINKTSIASRLAKVGIETTIANGTKSDIIINLIKGKDIVSTTFIASEKVSSVKRWLAYAKDFENGSIKVNKGASIALMNQDKANSLLPIGVIDVKGKFEKGDIVKILDEKDNVIGVGIASYNYVDAIQNKGKHNKKEIVHYDNLLMDK